MRTRHSPRRQQRETGSVIVLVTFFMLAMLGFAALSIDVAHVYQQQRDMQSATDVAALAGVALLTNHPPSLVAVIQAAQTIAQTNGVSQAEITASNFGAIEVGRWNTNGFGGGTFSAAATPYNAVRVPAKRTVSLLFGKVIGFGQMNPTALSVAMLTAAGSSYGGNGGGFMPFGVDQAQATNAFYAQYQVCQADVGGSGNFGQLDVGGTGWYGNMVNGCNCTVSVGETVSTFTGKNGCCPDCTPVGLAARLASNPYGVMPVVGNWPSGSSGPANVIGLIGVKIDAVSGCGGGWCMTLENVPVDLGGGGGTTTNAPYGLARVLVQ